MLAVPYSTGMVTTDRPTGYLYIRERMEAVGLDDDDVAAACGVYRETVNRWGNGKRRPNAEKMALLVKALKCKHPLDLFLPPGKMVVVIDLAEEIAKAESHEKPLDSPPMRRRSRVRQ